MQGRCEAHGRKQTKGNIHWSPNKNIIRRVDDEVYFLTVGRLFSFRVCCVFVCCGWCLCNFYATSYFERPRVFECANTPECQLGVFEWRRSSFENADRRRWTHIHAELLALKSDKRVGQLDMEHNTLTTTVASQVRA